MVAIDLSRLNPSQIIDLSIDAGRAAHDIRGFNAINRAKSSQEVLLTGHIPVDAFDGSLWEGNGLDQDALESVKAALAAIKDESSEQEQVPKAVAALLVDMFPVTESNAAAYKELGSSDASQIEGAAYEFQQLIPDALLE